MNALDEQIAILKDNLDDRSELRKNEIKQQISYLRSDIEETNKEIQEYEKEIKSATSAILHKRIMIDIVEELIFSLEELMERENNLINERKQVI